MRHKYDKSKFIEILTESPSISFASKKTGIGRATIYRWMKDNSKFREAVNEAIRHGRTYMTELAEMVLIKRMKDGDLNAAKYVLSHTDSRYTPKRTILNAPKDHTEPCRHCEKCGYPERSKNTEARDSANGAIEEYLNQICICKDEDEKDGIESSFISTP